MESCENWGALAEEYANSDIPQILDILQLSNFPDASLLDAGNKCRLGFPFI